MSRTNTRLQQPCCVVSLRSGHALRLPALAQRPGHGFLHGALKAGTGHSLERNTARMSVAPKMKPLLQPNPASGVTLGALGQVLPVEVLD